MTIAVDFDGTIVEHRYPRIGEEIPFATATLKMLINERHRLILWSVREGKLLEEAGLRKSLEDDFGGGSVRYKSLDGLNSKGKQKGVYTESYPESDETLYARPGLGSFSS